VADPTPKLYEGMFLVSQSAISAGLGSALDLVRGMLDRAEAEVEALSKWEERKLAYPIANQKRGTFLLAYFKVRPTQIANIERDCNLSEDVLRVMMTRVDHFGETELEQAKQDALVTRDEATLTDDAPADEAPAGDAEAKPEAKSEETAEPASA
jgi:small subunit ribosomal protein S6